MNNEIVHGKLVAKRDGTYTVYVFQIDDGSYRMCTKLPNWGPYNIQIGDEGFLTIEEAVAGETYYDRNTDTNQIYKFTNVYFKEFIKDNKQITTKILL